MSGSDQDGCEHGTGHRRPRGREGTGRQLAKRASPFAAPGVFSIPVGISGLELGLDQPNLLNTLRADEDGEVRFDITAPAEICDLSLQAIDLAACAASNVTTVDGN